MKKQCNRYYEIKQEIRWKENMVKYHNKENQQAIIIMKAYKRDIKKLNKELKDLLINTPKN
jgi:hypothetical protein